MGNHPRPHAIRALHFISFHLVSFRFVSFRLDWIGGWIRRHGNVGGLFGKDKRRMMNKGDSVSSVPRSLTE